MQFPDGKQFAFSVFDDADYAGAERAYRFLQRTRGRLARGGGMSSDA